MLMFIAIGCKSLIFMFLWHISSFHIGIIRKSTSSSTAAYDPAVFRGRVCHGLPLWMSPGRSQRDTGPESNIRFNERTTDGCLTTMEGSNNMNVKRYLFMNDMLRTWLRGMAAPSDNVVTLTAREAREFSDWYKRKEFEESPRITSSMYAM